MSVYSEITLAANKSCLICGCEIKKHIGDRLYSFQNLREVKACVYKCESCDFYECDPSFSNTESLEASYYGSSQTYNFMFEAITEKHFKKRSERLLNYANLRKVMDFGCGGGDLIKFLKTHYDEVVGLEPSKGLAKSTAQKYNVPVFDQRINDSSIPNEEFDAIFAIHSIEHVLNPHETISCLKSILKKGGYMCIEVPNSNSNIYRLQNLVHRFFGKKIATQLTPLHPPFHHLGYTEKSMTYLLKKNSFKIKDIYTLNLETRIPQNSSFKSVFFAGAKILSQLILSPFGNREALIVIAQKT